MAAFIDPAGTMVMVPDHIRAAHHTPDYASDDRARRTSNDGARTGADRDAFQRSGLGHDRQRGQHQHEHSGFKRETHEKSPWFISLFASKNAGVIGKTAIHEMIT